MAYNTHNYKSIRDDWILELTTDVNGLFGGAIQSPSRGIDTGLWVFSKSGQSTSRQMLHATGKYDIEGAGLNGGPRGGIIKVIGYGESFDPKVPPELYTMLVSFISDFADIDGLIKFDQYLSDPLPFRLER